MEQPYISAELRALLDQVTGKRARLVVEHIAAHGYVTSEEIKQLGYEHPPRAVKDVRDQGIPLDTYFVKDSTGKRIAAYRFGDPSDIVGGRIGGRSAIPKHFKNLLVADSGQRCAICNAQLEPRELQVDHRVPYEIGGDTPFSVEYISEYMLLCGSCNRSKSWTCEHCENWTLRDRLACSTCYWASPQSYQHVALRQMRRVDIVWAGDEELAVHGKLAKRAALANTSIVEFIKRLLRSIVTWSV